MPNKISFKKSIIKISMNLKVLKQDEPTQIDVPALVLGDYAITKYLVCFDDNKDPVFASDSHVVTHIPSSLSCHTFSKQSEARLYILTLTSLLSKNPEATVTQKVDKKGLSYWATNEAFNKLHFQAKAAALAL